MVTRVGDFAQAACLMGCRYSPLANNNLQPLMKLIRYLTACILCHTTVLAETSGTQTLLQWQLAHTQSAAENPAHWIPATVPGAVQLDIAKAEHYAPYSYAGHWQDYLWMEDRFFTYRASFAKPKLDAHERYVFVSQGIDYQFKILLNGVELLNQEGMFTPVKLDLTEHLQDHNELRILVYPAPKLHPLPADRTQASHSVKPAVSYGWDWHPRLIPLGIWDDTYLEIQPAGYIENCQVDYTLNQDLTQAEIQLRMSVRNTSDPTWVWTLQDESGKEVLKSDGNTHLTLAHPRLWWPHDQGQPTLYTSVARLFDRSGKLLQTRAAKIGFRRIKLVMNEGAWREPEQFPKSRSVPPAQLEINGRKIFCKGTNWVNPEIFPGIITRERYDELLTLAKAANLNLLRVWGGGIVNKESFFELCDAKGLLVWQEFPLACNNYPDDAHYLAILKQESASIIQRVKAHPSLAFWCGGNELFNVWSGMTDQSMALRLLNSQCLELDPNSPFIPTSPLMGMGHGNYVFRDAQTREEVFSTMARSHCTAYTEFGMPAPAAVAILQTIIPPAELWPPRAGGSWESHHAFNAWVGNTWLCRDVIEDYFGTAGTLPELVANGQLLQAEGYKCIFEEARRQKPYCSMAANWCYNEPWPTAANNSLLSYPNIPKPGYYAVKNACRPVLASAKLAKFKWTEGETFVADAWMLSDLPTKVPAGKMTLKLVAGSAVLPVLAWDFNALPANVNQPGPTLRCQLPGWATDRFKLVLEVEGHPEYNSEYTLAYQPRTVERKRTTPVMNQ